jgi:Fe-S-cluster containining protein
MIVNLRSFRQKARRRKSVFKRFLGQLVKNPPQGLDQLTAKANLEVWRDVDCLSCANCCKTMTPTYTLKDIRRIAAHLGMSVADMQKKWLRKEKGTGDWLNRSTPCQFLDSTTNMCGIYDVRPADCAGFPHLAKRKMVEYMHVHKQNIDLCPATFKMVERMMKEMNAERR